MVGGIRLSPAAHCLTRVERDDHDDNVTTLTSAQPRNTRCTLLLLVLTGGRVMGSYDQMTLPQALGPPNSAAERVRERRHRSC